MWQMAYAEDTLGANENHLITEVAGLLHVTHGEYIAAKMRAKEDARLPQYCHFFTALKAIKALASAGKR